MLKNERSICTCCGKVTEFYQRVNVSICEEVEVESRWGRGTTRSLNKRKSWYFCKDCWEMLDGELALSRFISSLGKKDEDWVSYVGLTD